jgi:hypothetical protein
MARRRNAQGGGALVLIGVVLAAVAFLGPFVVASWSIFNELRARRFRGAATAGDLIAASERSTLSSSETEMADLEHAASSLYRDGDDDGLQRRMDARRFDARNARGRYLNHALEQIESQYQAAAARQEALKALLEARINAWLEARSSLVGARSGLIVFVCVFVALVIKQAPAASGPFSFYRLMFGLEGDGTARVNASIAATIVSGLVGWVAAKVSRASLAA